MGGASGTRLKIVSQEGWLPHNLIAGAGANGPPGAGPQLSLARKIKDLKSPFPAPMLSVKKDFTASASRRL
jgi:hypothetical protein